MDKKFTIEAKHLKNIVLFNPEVGHDDLSNAESSIFIKVANGTLKFEILSFRYLLTGIEEVKASEDIEMILPLKRLQDIVKSFSDNTKITFKEDNEKTVSVEVDGIKFKIKTCEQEGRNQIDTDKGEEYKVSKEEMLEGIKKVRIAMGDDEVRYYLNGINIEIYKNKDGVCYPFMVATNGHILATSGTKNENDELLQKAIMPKKVIPEIIKILEKTEEKEVAVSFSKSKMDLKTKNLEILLKLIEGDFPDYNKVIPYNNSKEVIINNDSLKDLLGKVSVVSNDKTKNVKMSISANNVDLEIISSDGSMANGNIAIDYSGDNLEIILNAKYLIDILSQITEKNVVFKLEDGVSPLLIKQESSDSLLFVLMPIRL